MKNTTKLVTDIPYPALTLCGSGVHMNNVEKKLVQDFKDWRTLHMRTKTNEEEIKKDMKVFIEEKFQIKPAQDEGESMDILDILDMMIAPDVDASLSAKGVRENEIACKQSKDDNSCCTHCSDDRFSLLGSRCFYVPTDKVSQPEAVKACLAMGAELATIETREEDAFVYQLGGGGWIGLTRKSTSAHTAPSSWY